MHAATERELHKLHAGLSDSAPGDPTWSDRIAAVKGQAQRFGKVDGVRDLNPSARICNVPHDTVDGRGRTDDDLGAF